MRPIPRSALTHTATLQTGVNSFGGEMTYTPVAVLTRIKIDPSSAQVLTASNTATQLTGTLFYDTRNSLPKGIAFVVGQFVLMADGARRRIERVDPMYEDNRLHHYEVGLSG